MDEEVRKMSTSRSVIKKETEDERNGSIFEGKRGMEEEKESEIEKRE